METVRGDDLGDTPAPHAARRIPRLGRGARVVLGVAIVLLVALVALWLARKPIADRVIERELARRGVVARYKVAGLGFGRQRLTAVVIGDPADPDLVADWLETDTHVGLGGPVLTGIRAGHVRLRGRVSDGRVSLGELDKLLPAPSGKPFALPALRVNLADGRLRLETPAGVLGLKASGRGRLDDGFAGQIAAVSERLAAGGCVARGVAAAWRVTIAAGAPHVVGPLRLADARCGEARIAAVGAEVDARLTAALDGWRGAVRLASGAARGTGIAAAGVAGTLDFAGSRAATAGKVDLAARQVRGVPGSAAGVAVAGRYRIDAAQRFAGHVRVTGAGAAPRLLARLDPAAVGAGTPLAPLAQALGRAAGRAGQRFEATADLAVVRDGAAGLVRLGGGTLAAASGARVALAGGSGVTFGWPGARLRVDTGARIGGGGLPQGSLTLAQERPGAPIRGVARFAPYAAGGARLALTPVRFTATPGGATQVTTQATLSGPVADGRVDGLALPLDLRWDGRDRLAINPGCTPVAMAGLRAAGLTLAPLRTVLCPLGGAIVSLGGGRLAGGARFAATRLSGRLGSTPLALAARGGELRLGDGGFAIESVSARLGSGERVSRLDLGTLAGRWQGGTLAGRFADGAGQIANVPLLLGAAAGDWSLRGGALALAGAMTVSDAAADPRFRPLAARSVALTLRGGAITARGTLVEPTQGVRVAEVTIDHSLASGRGAAAIAVPGLTFTEAFQPDLLTRLTFGVIADVRATVTGEGHIAWSPTGVTSTGRFATSDAALAAAFGPVSGITTSIAFTDLLALESAPDQVATIKAINPGIAVTDGTITYQTLAGSRVRVNQGRWPFAGGTLTLLPTLLDFATPQPRRMTFRLDGVAADQFLEQFDFKNLDATGVFDGELPMVFDVDGGRIERGHLAVRQGGGSLAYVGDLSQKDLGIWGNIAFQALKSLRYRNLTIAMNGPLAGEMVTDVRFAGVSQGKGAKANFLVRRLQKLPFVFNIRIKAPFRGLLDSAQSFYDPSRLIQRNLPALIERQQGKPPAIQPPASETVP